MTLDDATQAMKGLFDGKDSGIGRTLKLDFGGDGVVFIDAKNAPNSVSNENREADTTLVISLVNFGRLRSGELQGQQAFMTGELKVEGDLMGAMAFGSYTAG
jgi:putative sterol carrier protein